MPAINFRVDDEFYKEVNEAVARLNVDNSSDGYRMLMRRGMSGTDTESINKELISLKNLVLELQKHQVDTRAIVKSNNSLLLMIRKRLHVNYHALRFIAYNFFTAVFPISAKLEIDEYNPPKKEIEEIVVSSFRKIETTAINDLVGRENKDE